MKERGSSHRILIGIEGWWNFETCEPCLIVFCCDEFRVRWIILTKYSRRKQVRPHAVRYGVSSNVRSWEIFVPRCVVNVQMCSMDTANAVVMSSGLVHKIAIVFGWRSNLSRKCRRSVAAGVMALSRVMVVWMTCLLWSEISKSLNPNLREVQNRAL